MKEMNSLICVVVVFLQKHGKLEIVAVKERKVRRVYSTSQHKSHSSSAYRFKTASFDGTARREIIGCQRTCCDKMLCELRTSL
jgi:hypothetical protein